MQTCFKPTRMALNPVLEAMSYNFLACKLWWCWNIVKYLLGACVCGGGISLPVSVGILVWASHFLHFVGNSHVSSWQNKTCHATLWTLLPLFMFPIPLCHQLKAQAEGLVCRWSSRGCSYWRGEGGLNWFLHADKLRQCARGAKFLRWKFPQDKRWPTGGS